jgi:hypothetical protein
MTLLPLNEISRHVPKKNYSIHPHIFIVYKTNRNDLKYLTSPLISVLTLSVLTNLPFFILILSSLVGIDPAAPPAGGGAVVGCGAMRIHRSSVGHGRRRRRRLEA